MSVPVFTHALHGSLASRAADVLAQGNLLAVSGRILAVAQGTSVDVYDTSDAADMSDVLGAGSCKLHFVSSVSVADIAAPLTVTSLAFLPGGLLALVGSCARGTIVHAYKLSFTTKNGAARPFKTDLALAAAPSLATHALPQLVFRAALPVGAHVQLLPHPTLAHTLGIVVAGDTAVRFYDCSPASDASVPALSDCSSGVVVHCGSGSPVSRASISRDGRVLALATEEREIAVCELLLGPLVVDGVCTGRTLVSGRHHVSFVCERAVTAMAVLVMPAPPDAASYARFRLNGYGLVTGHCDGTLNVWWAGDVEGGDGGGGGEKRGGSAPSFPRPPSYVVKHTPLASYPAFHASRGPITYLSPAFTVDEGEEGREGVPAVFRRSAEAGGEASPPGSNGPADSNTAYTAVCVGAHGARGWRVLTFPHVPLRLSALAQASGGRSVRCPPPASPPPPLSRPDGGRWGYDETGHKTWLQQPPKDSTHLLQPYFATPSYASVIASPILGDCTGFVDASPRGGSTRGGAPPALVLTAPPMTGPGIEPRGAVLLQRFPSADSAVLSSSAGVDVCSGGTGDAGRDAAALYPGLPPSSATLDRGVFKLLARDYAGNFHVTRTATDGRGGRGDGTGMDHHRCTSAFKRVPRTVVLLLTEKGVHVAGFDYHEALTGDARPETLAARALGFPLTHEEVTSTGWSAPEQPFFGGFAAYAVPGRAGGDPAAVPPVVRATRAVTRAGEVADARAAVGRGGGSAGGVSAPPKPPVPSRLVSAASGVSASRELAGRTRRRVHAPPPPSGPRPKAAWPMSLTGRQDSIIRGHRAVFQDETLAGALGGPDKIHDLPRAAVDRLNETAYSSGHGAAERAAARSAEEEGARRTGLKNAYLPRHTAARLAQRGAGGMGEVGGASGRAGAALPVWHPAPPVHPVDTASVDMDLEGEEEGSGGGKGGRAPLARSSGTGASTQDPTALAFKLSAMQSELASIRRAAQENAALMHAEMQGLALALASASPRRGVK